MAARLTVFQRTANYTVPVLNRRFTPHEWNELQRAYPERRRRSWASLAGTPHVAYHKQYAEIGEAERLAAFEARWREGGVLFGKTFDGQAVDPDINEAARRFAERKVREIVRDPQTPEDLLPSGHPLGAKRICTDSGYLETCNRGNVELVNLRRDPMVRITERGVETVRASHDLDVLVLATGFDAMTGALTRIDVRGPRGDVLAQTWAQGPLTHLGLGVPGFPDLFVLTGRGCPAGLSDLTLAAEQQVNWLMELLAHYRERGVRTVEARADAAQAWTRRVDEAARATLFPRADSWYLGADVSGKPRVFMPYIGDFRPYADRCDDDRDRGYAGWHVGDVTTADAEALAGPAQRAAGTVRGGPWTTT